LLPIVAARIAEQTGDKFFVPVVANERLAWELRNVSRDFSYLPDDTLSARGIAQGEMLYLSRCPDRIKIVATRPAGEISGREAARIIAPTARRIRVIPKS
jgi:hypothetical protein